MTIEEWGYELDALLPTVTAAAVEKALKNSKCRLVDGRDWEWLAMAVRRALAIAKWYGVDHPDSPERVSNVNIREELKALADAARSLAEKLRVLSDGAADKVQEHGDATYDRLAAATNEVAWLMHFAERAAGAIEVPRKQVLNPDRKKMRTDWARFLAPVFETAFGQRVTVANKTVTTNDLALNELSAFQFFYLRMAEVAFGPAARADTNIVGVTKEARRKHRDQPVQFAKGLIAGL